MLSHVSVEAFTGHRIVKAFGTESHEAKKFSAAGLNLFYPPPSLCTDNGAMIAWAGAERLALGLTDSLEVAPRARWPLGDVTKVSETETIIPEAAGAPVEDPPSPIEQKSDLLE